MYVFLKELDPAKRLDFLPYIFKSSKSKEDKYAWRTKEILAASLGKYVELYEQQVVIENFVPLFFNYSYDTVARVSQAVASSFGPILEKVKGDKV